MIERNKIYQGDCLEVLKTFPDEFVQCVITSPPYWGLRDYGTAEWVGGNPDCSHRRDSKKSDKCITGHKNFDKMLGVGDAIQKEICSYCGARRVDKQLGLESTPEEYVEKLVEICREVRRVLRSDGVFYLNLGDTYAGSGCGTKDYRTPGSKSINRSDKMFSKKPPQQKIAIRNNGIKPKNLVGIPWMVAFALRADGWHLRQDIIWHKPNPMPESVKDRFTKAHEYIFLLTKSPRYYFDQEAVKVPAKYDGRKDTTIKGSKKYKDGAVPGSNAQGLSKGGRERWNWDENGVPKRNPRSVFVTPTKPYKEAHFATFPIDLIEPCVLASTSEKGCCPTCGNPLERIIEVVPGNPDLPRRAPEGSEVPGGGRKRTNENGTFPHFDGPTVKTVGWKPTCDCGGDPVPCVVLDPFFGAGTVGVASVLNNRNWIGIELNSDYIKMADIRIKQAQTGLTKEEIQNGQGVLFDE